MKLWVLIYFISISGGKECDKPFLKTMTVEGYDVGCKQRYWRVFDSTTTLIEKWDTLDVEQKKEARIFEVNKQLFIEPVVTEKYKIATKYTEPKESDEEINLLIKIIGEIESINSNPLVTEKSRQAGNRLILELRTEIQNMSMDKKVK